MKRTFLVYVVLCTTIICLALSFSNAQSGGCGDCSIDDKWPKVGSCLILIGEYEGDGGSAILATGDKRKCKDAEKSKCPLDWQTGCYKSGTLPEYVIPS
ncbi:hypothetical protein [Roseivirga sp. UBA1976]|jgi:hypothetical protein|uniref:hypothetical protein n=1 Tax=Roseivirga sp. UBA1976 TaxID=1947386 RepID=UPI00257B4977|nr:hypothetical protein [Roseivirga sp. UBA1976]MEC7753205.1 hypothetical protein [Bacteroidota bacterium]|tara:strand:- start:3633 stop:3929 length:297 start_codon:yes stop_codon:yes gene_type:complete